jgi:predicted trehalose synthase
MFSMPGRKNREMTTAHTNLQGDDEWAWTNATRHQAYQNLVTRRLQRFNRFHMISMPSACQRYLLLEFKSDALQFYHQCMRGAKCQRLNGVILETFPSNAR